MNWACSNGSGCSIGRPLAVRIECALRPVTTPPMAPSVVSATKTHPNGIDCWSLCRMLAPPLNMFPECFVSYHQVTIDSRTDEDRKRIVVVLPPLWHQGHRAQPWVIRVTSHAPSSRLLGPNDRTSPTLIG